MVNDNISNCALTCWSGENGGQCAGGLQRTLQHVHIASTGRRQYKDALVLSLKGLVPGRDHFPMA
jgi:hypothetical protein